MNDSTHASAHHQAAAPSRSAAARVQAKLSVGPSRDAYEQEADRVAGSVVGHAALSNGPAAAPSGAQRMPVAGAVAAPKISRLSKSGPRRRPQRQEAEKEERQAKVERREEEKQQVQRQEEEEPAGKLQRQEEEEPAGKLQRQEEEEPAGKLQRQEEEEPAGKLQRQEEEEPAGKLQRQEEEEPAGKLQRQEEEEPAAKLQRRVETRANVKDKRRFPVLDQVEGKLFETKGKGEPLDESTRISMETGFGADFSQVRVHTGADAVDMSREMRAQAFTHGKDVFFNSGKFEPDTVRGRVLLAHELTHVVQQGAAEQKVPPERIEKNNAEKGEAPPEPADKKALEVEKGTEERIAEGEPVLGEPPAVAEEEAVVGAEAAAPAAEAEELPPEEAKPEEEAEAKTEEEKPKEKAEEVEAKKAPGAKKAAEKTEAKGGAVGQFLRKTTKAVFQAKKARVGKLAANQKKKEDAAAKLAQTEKAVTPPAEESQSRAKASQVQTVEAAPEPQPDEAKAKEEFDAALEKAIPTSLEEVDSFKEQGKGRVVGQAVKGVVTADTQQVKGTYQEIDNPPPPAPPEREPEELPELETAPETAPIDMGEGVVGEVQPEHTDLSEFDKESDQQLEKEGIKEEHLEMVDEGDLAEAKKERKSLKTKVVEGPREVKLLEQQEKEKVRKDLQKEEQEGKGKMREERNKELLGARGDQKKTKSALELKRQQVTEQINGIYQKANDTVKQKLEDLEKKSLQEFEKGEKAATKTFEDNVKRRIDAFKRRRYDRFGGSLLWLKDKLLGMDDLPEVKEIFDSEKNRFIAAIDALVKKITAENKRVIQECKDIVSAARQEIEKFVEGLGPELRKTGQDAFKEMKGKLDALDQKINQKEKELQKKLAEKREAAIKAIEEKIEKMKEEMSGLLAKLGNFLLNAMVKFFKWALKKAGYASDQLMGIINKGKAVIKKIVTDPIGFIGNIIKAVKDGIGLFVTNIKKHLISGLISWLTGAMSDVPITLPSKWDLKGILHLVLQILGLTWDRIRKKLVKRLGEKVVRIAETSVDILKRLITEGPIALWNMIKAKAAEIKQKVMEGIRNWVIAQVVKQAIIKLLSFLNPAGAIIQAILAIYNTIMFFVENWDRIVTFVKTVFGSIADIAMGKLAAASQAVERALAMTIPIILNFLARLIGLSGIGKAVSKIIRQIRKPIDKVVDKVVKKVAELAKKLLKKGKAVAKAVKEKALAVIQWWKGKKTFRSADGGEHKLYYRGSGKGAKLMVASDSPDEVQEFLKDQGKKPGIAGAKSAYKDVLKGEKDLKKLQDQSPNIKGKEKKRAHRHKIMTAKESLWDAIEAFSKSIKGMEFEKETDLLIKTEVKPDTGNKASSVTARPLTWLSGNTKGSRPQEDPPGWKHAQTLPDRWERGHLLSMHFHGPGEKWNLVPITTATNSAMQSVEDKVKPKIAKKGAILHYKTKIESWHQLGPPANNDFPENIKIRWGVLKAKRAASGKPTFEEVGKAENKPITQGPPALAGVAKNINDFGAETLAGLTNTTVRFMMVVLKEKRTKRGRFANYKDLKDRMWKHQSQEMGAATMQKHLASVYHASRGANKKIVIGP